MTLLRGVIFALFLLISVPVQLYLFSALRKYVQQRVHHVRWRRNLICLSAWFFILMFLPIAWRAFFGGLFYVQKARPWLLRIRTGAIFCARGWGWRWRPRLWCPVTGCLWNAAA